MDSSIAVKADIFLCGVDDDTEGDFPSLQNDEILDKDESLDSIGRKTKEDLFNELCAEHENDWFGYIILTGYIEIINK